MSQLPVQSLSQRPGLLNPDQHKTFRVSPNDPALSVMTAFRRIRPFSISESADLLQTKDKMIACSVRLLFVTDLDEHVTGLITASDLSGERPIKYLQEHHGDYQSILARDIMTPVIELEAFNYNDVVKAKIADLIDAMKDCQRQHMLVLHHNKDGHEQIVGMFSTTQMEKQLGIVLPFSNRARNFREIEEALA